MSMPTETELKAALGEAIRMREQAEDPHCVAKALLNAQYRLGLLEKVLSSAKHFLHSGLAPHEHTELLRAIERVDKASLPLGREREAFGLESDA